MLHTIAPAGTGFVGRSNPFTIALPTVTENVVFVGFVDALLPCVQFSRTNLSWWVGHGGYGQFAHGVCQPALVDQLGRSPVALRLPAISAAPSD